MRLVRRAALVGVALFAAIQLVPYGRAHDNPPVTSAAPWPSDRAAEIADRSCAMCHSNTTEWPWYSHVAPASWLVAYDVEEGREEFNFSTWDRDAGEADEAVETVIEGTMPPLKYVLIHPDARLSEEEARILVDALRQMED